MLKSFLIFMYGGDRKNASCDDSGFFWVFHFLSSKHGKSGGGCVSHGYCTNILACYSTYLTNMHTLKKKE